MKKYKSPIFEIEAIDLADIITASVYETITFNDSGNLDSGDPDTINW